MAEGPISIFNHRLRVVHKWVADSGEVEDCDKITWTVLTAEKRWPRREAHHDTYHNVNGVISIPV